MDCECVEKQWKYAVEKLKKTQSEITFYSRYFQFLTIASL